MYIGKDISKERKLKIQYDKKGRKRPAWIKIEGLTKECVSNCGSSEWKKNILSDLPLTEDSVISPRKLYERGNT